MFYLFSLTFIIIYFQLSTTDQIQLIIWIIVFFSSNFLIGFNPFSFKLHIIRILSIIIIFYITLTNLDQSIYLLLNYRLF